MPDPVISTTISVADPGGDLRIRVVGDEINIDSRGERITISFAELGRIAALRDSVLAARAAVATMLAADKR